ncbi:MAG: hypothetical protein NWE98_05305 [Candidatus Bathyarchaeota archaeon]|nr:hypothetical protein [Candidatus Bathyarchaeota archaeon]
MKFIVGIHNVLRDEGVYMLTCFSDSNGPGWNHFTKQQISDYFGGHFTLGEMLNYPSLEGDGVVRFFYTVLMQKR